MIQELDTNKHILSKSQRVYTPKIITVRSCTLGKQKKATFLNHPVYHRRLCRN